MSDQNPDVIQIHLTSTAVAAALRLRTEKLEFSGLSLRIYLAGKGCDGFEYGVTFDAAAAGDHHFPRGPEAELDVIVDTPTLEFVDGSTIDWVDDARGQGFLVENPNSRRFRGKFYKRKAWLDRLAPAASKGCN